MPDERQGPRHKVYGARSKVHGLCKHKQRLSPTRQDSHGSFLCCRDPHGSSFVLQDSTYHVVRIHFGSSMLKLRDDLRKSVHGCQNPYENRGTEARMPGPRWTMVIVPNRSLLLTPLAIVYRLTKFIKVHGAAHCARCKVHGKAR